MLFVSFTKLLFDFGSNIKTAVLFRNYCAEGEGWIFPEGKITN